MLHEIINISQNINPNKELRFVSNGMYDIRVALGQRKRMTRERKKGKS